MNIRITFKKGEDIRYISHLDLVRTFNRLLHRSKLPVKYSEGFNPHICLNFGLPLAVGMISERESCEIVLNGKRSLEDIRKALSEAAPGGIEIVDVTDKEGIPYKKIEKAKYEVITECNMNAEEIRKILSAEEIVTPKKSKRGIKEVDIKPLIYSYEVSDLSEGKVKSEFILAAGNEKNLNPLLVISAMSLVNPEFKADFSTAKRICLMTGDNKII